MIDESYPPPIDQLFTLDEVQPEPWPNYLKLGIGPEHVPDLIRLATSYPLEDADSPVESAVWMASVHAWRALGQLGAEAATEPLLGLVAAGDGDEWITEELPEVFSLIGPSVIPPLVAFLADRRHPPYSRTAAGEGLTRLALRDPASREACVAALIAHLDRGDDDRAPSGDEAEASPLIDQDRFDAMEVDSFVVTMLMRLKAVEAGPAIERAFAAERIDEAIPGDWEDVQVQLGLLAERLTPRPRYDHFARWRDAMGISLGDDLQPRRRRPGYRPAQPAVTRTPKTKRRAPKTARQGKKRK